MAFAERIPALGEDPESCSIKPSGGTTSQVVTPCKWPSTHVVGRMPQGEITEVSSHEQPEHIEEEDAGASDENLLDLKGIYEQRAVGKEPKPKENCGC
jgi:hypothetical protein